MSTRNEPSRRYDPEATMAIRVSELDWITIKNLIQSADANGDEDISPSLSAKFMARRFEPEPKIIGLAADLIADFAKLRNVTGPLTVHITGEKGAGKTTLAQALMTALSTVRVPVQIHGEPPLDPDASTPTVLIQDGGAPRFPPGPSIRETLRRQGVVHFVPASPLSARLRRSLGRLMAYLRALRR